MLPGPYKTVPFIANLLLLNHCHSAVHSQRMSHHVACPRTAQPQYGRGNLLRRSGAAAGNALRDFRVRLLIPADDVAADLRVDETGIDRVHADPTPDIFQCGGPRQPDYSVLGSDI